MEIPYGPLISEISRTLSDAELPHVVCGGAVVPLLMDIEPYYPFRATDDVDLIIPVSHQRKYAEIEERLRARGFRNDIRESAPLCRWIYRGQTVDIMPVPGEFIGLKTTWFREALDTACEFEIKGVKVPVITATGFLA